MPRKTCKVFTSYARVDATSCRKLLRLLQVQTALSDKYDFLFWDDRLILEDEQLKPEIADAIAMCDFGLLLISPAYLNSAVEIENELPHFVGETGKPSIAVEIKTVAELTEHSQEIATRTVFRDGKRGFHSCTGRQQKLFVEKLHEQMEAQVSQFIG